MQPTSRTQGIASAAGATKETAMKVSVRARIRTVVRKGTPAPKRAIRRIAIAGLQAFG
jgi:hypothetical protein